MITVTTNKEYADMTRGGKREGAGRPKGEPTKTVRVVARAADAAPGLAAYFLEIAERAVQDNFFSTIKKYGYTPVVTLIGIETCETRGVMSGASTLTMLVATAEMGGLRTTFTVDLDGSRFYARDEERI